MIVEGDELLGASSLNVGWEARTAATRYLCAAAHLRRPMLPRTVRDGEGEEEREPHPVGRAFARRVIRGPGIVAPSPGVDTAWVIRHAHAAWTQAALRDFAALGALVACGYFFPAGTSVWVGLVLAGLGFSAVASFMKRKRRALVAAILVCATAGAITWLFRGGTSARSLRMPLLSFAFCLVVFAIDAFVACMRLRHLPKVLGREPRNPFPFGPLTRDLGAAAKLHRRNVVFYERGRIVGAGTRRFESVLTTPIDEPRKGRRVERFTAFDLLDYIAHHIRRQGEHGDNTFGLPQLMVREVLAKPASTMKKAPFTVPETEIREAANKSTSGTADRAYVAASTTTWDGELTGSIYVSVALEGRYLRLTVLPYVMAPVVDELRAADSIAARGLLKQAAMSVPSGAVEIVLILAELRSRIRNAVKKWREPAKPSVDRLFPETPSIPTTLSLRELYAKDYSEDLHQRHDGSRIVQVMEQRVFSVVETYLDEHGIATERFRAQADQVISNYITVNGSNNNIATGSGSTAGNSAPQPAQPTQQGAQ